MVGAAYGREPSVATLFAGKARSYDQYKLRGDIFNAAIEQIVSDVHGRILWP